MNDQAPTIRLNLWQLDLDCVMFSHISTDANVDKINTHKKKKQKHK